MRGIRQVCPHCRLQEFLLYCVPHGSKRVVKKSYATFVCFRQACANSRCRKALLAPRMKKNQRGGEACRRLAHPEARRISSWWEVTDLPRRLQSCAQA